MESADHQNANARLGSTWGESAPQGHSIMILLALHAFMFSLIGVLGVYLQLKFPNVSTYATAHGTVMMDLIIIETCFYIVSLVVMGILAARNNTDFEDLMNNISLLLGSLSLILELLVLIEPFGWIALFFWSICLLCFLSRSYQSLNTLCQSAVPHLVQDFGQLKQKLVDLNRRMMGSNAIAALGGAYQTLKDLIIRNDRA
ncbi:hypothetical protein ABKV19_010496 [Rosa sericea]